MRSITDIHLLFHYYYWATAQILHATEQVSNEQFTRVRAYCQRSLRATLTHAISSEMIWRTRWQNALPVGNLDEQMFPTPQSLRLYWREQEQAMYRFLSTIQDADLDRIVQGKTGDGTSYADPIWHLMMQVLFHGAQHRSEVAEIVSEYGYSPGELDFFVFLRHREKAPVPTTYL